MLLDAMQALFVDREWMAIVVSRSIKCTSDFR